MTTASFYFQSAVIAGWGQHFLQVVLNRSAKSSPRRQSRRLQKDRKSLRRMKRLLVMKQQHLHSALEKHLSSEKCTKSLEKGSLLDLAKIAYKSALEEGVGTIPTLQPVPGSERRADCCNKEGWALKSTKKAYRFNEKQKAYLDAKFSIGQTSGRKVDGEVVAREMRRALGPDGARLFNVAEFLSPQQIASYFSRLAAKVRKQLPDDCDVQASEEEINFTLARNLALETISLQHPIVFDQFDICTMVKNDTLKKLKLGMLQSICQNLELNVPVPAIRRKAPYLALLGEAVSQCSCQICQ